MIGQASAACVAAFGPFLDNHPSPPPGGLPTRVTRNPGLKMAVAGSVRPCSAWPISRPESADTHRRQQSRIPGVHQRVFSRADATSSRRH